MNYQPQPFNIRASLSPADVQLIAAQTIAKMDADRAAYQKTDEYKNALAQYVSLGGQSEKTNLENVASTYEWLSLRGE
jgi:hypothetical protein